MKKTVDSSTRHWDRERGQSLVELAVSFTLLLLILGVTIDVGRMFYTYIAIREAAEEGALYGSMLGELVEYPEDKDKSTLDETKIKKEIRARVKDSSAYTIDLTNWTELKDIPDDQIQVFFTSGAPNKNAIYNGSGITEKAMDDVCSGDSITVYIRYDFNMFMPMTSTMTQNHPIEFKYLVTNKVLTPICD